MSTSRRAIALAVLLVSLVSVSHAADASLFVNLTSDELNRAAMAIGLATQVRTQAEIPVALFLNVEGVNLADRSRPQHVHANGQTIEAMLQAFMTAGGKVVVCPMCMEHVGGMTADDVIAGAVLGGSDHGTPELLADGVRVLSY
jgi:predicted peroxiredoxin